MKAPSTKTQLSLSTTFHQQSLLRQRQSLKNKNNKKHEHQNRMKKEMYVKSKIGKCEKYTNQVLKNIVSGDEIGLAVEFDKSSPIVSVRESESEQTLGGRTSGLLGRQYFASLPELSLRSLDVPIGFHQCGLHVLYGRARSFPQLLYQIRLIRSWRSFGGESSTSTSGIWEEPSVEEDGSDRARAFCYGRESHDLSEIQSALTLTLRLRVYRLLTTECGVAASKTLILPSLFFLLCLWERNVLFFFSFIFSHVRIYFTN